MRIIPVETTTHGRVLLEDHADDPRAGVFVAFHGYGQNADDILTDVRKIPGIDRWQVAAVQALNRFYTRDEGVVASWMTRQDRELAIADNIAYVDRAVDSVFSSVRRTSSAVRLVFAGFSQGAAMAYRAGLLGRHRASAIIALGGDVPPDVKTIEAARWPRVLIGAGLRDSWYTPAKIDADESFLRSQQIDYQIVRFDGGHLWTDEFRRAVGEWLKDLSARF